MRPGHGAASLGQCLERLVGSEHAVHGETVEDALYLCKLFDRPEGLKRLVIAVF